MNVPTDGPLLRALLDNGFESLSHLSIAIKIKHETLSHINNNYRKILTVYGAGGGLTETAKRLSEALGCNPEDAYYPQAHFNPKNPQPVTPALDEPATIEYVPEYDHYNDNELSGRIEKWLAFLFTPIRKYVKSSDTQDVYFDVITCYVRSKLRRESFISLLNSHGFTEGQAKGRMENVRLMCSKYYNYETGDISCNLDLFDWLH